MGTAVERSLETSTSEIQYSTGEGNGRSIMGAHGDGNQSLI